MPVRLDTVLFTVIVSAIIVKDFPAGGVRFALMVTVPFTTSTTVELAEGAVLRLRLPL